MIKIDIHHHLVEEVGYIDGLLKIMDRYEIEKSSLIGLGPLFKGLFVKNKYTGKSADNDMVAGIIKKYPERFFGLGFIRCGVDGPDAVDYLYENGFTGLKFHIPTDRYDSKRFFPIFEKAERYGMPCLFHTGIVALPLPAHKENISSFNMDVIHLEAIAQTFPDLKIIIAHLGVQNYLTALTLIRIFPNIYADLSGSIPGWRANISFEEWKKLLWFDNASDKIVFGTDVHYSEVGESIDIYEEIFNAVGWGDKEKKKVYYKNANRLLGMARHGR